MPFQDCFDSLDSVLRLPATGQFVTLAGEAEHLRLDTVVPKQSEQLLALLDGTPPVCLGVQNKRGGRDPVGVTERLSCPEFVPGRPLSHVHAIEERADVPSPHERRPGGASHRTVRGSRRVGRDA